MKNRPEVAFSAPSVPWIPSGGPAVNAIGQLMANHYCKWEWQVIQHSLVLGAVVTAVFSVHSAKAERFILWLEQFCSTAFLLVTVCLFISQSWATFRPWFQLPKYTILPIQAVDSYILGLRMFTASLRMFKNLFFLSAPPHDRLRLCQNLRQCWQFRPQDMAAESASCFMLLAACSNRWTISLTIKVFWQS